MSDRIEFEEFRGENGGNWMGTSMNFPQYTQVGVCSEEQRRLIFEWQKGRLELDKNQEKNNQRLAYEKESQAMKVYFDAFRTLLGAEVYRNAGGILVYAVTDPDGQTIRSRKLLSVEAYESRMLISANPCTRVLEVSWKTGEEHVVYFPNAENGIPTEVFSKKLKAQGVEFLVSGRSEKKAATALLAFSFRDAPWIYIPFYHGWGQDAKGEWHYAADDELTMQEVLSNV